MRVLHLPANIASQASITVRALRQLGVAAEGVDLWSQRLQDADGVWSQTPVSRDELGPWLRARTRAAAVVLRRISTSDVVHWHFGSGALPYSLDLRWARWLRKPGVAEFWGSDLRVPELAAAESPYYARMGDAYEYAGMESRSLSVARQRIFARYGVRTALVPINLVSHVEHGVFETVYPSRVRLLLEEFEPRYPDRGNRPVVVHSPTAKAGKGTEYVLKAIETLKSRCDFEFRLVHGMPRKAALEIVRSCDVFLDQFIEGSYGAAAVEAMAFGKPVLCYLSPTTLEALPREVPVVNATPDNLADVLEPLLLDAEQRRDLGMRSRRFVEAHHDALCFATWLVGVYERLVDERNRHA